MSFKFRFNVGSIPLKCCVNTCLMSLQCLVGFTLVLRYYFWALLGEGALGDILTRIVSNSYFGKRPGARDMTVFGSSVGSHNIHWYLSTYIYGSNIVIKERSHCTGLGAQLPSAEVWGRSPWATEQKV